MMSYGGIDVGQNSCRQWLVAWWQQAIIWTNVDLSSKVFYGIHMRAILHEMLMNLICNMYFQITFFKLPHLLGAKELIKHDVVLEKCTYKIWARSALQMS